MQVGRSGGLGVHAARAQTAAGVGLGPCACLDRGELLRGSGSRGSGCRVVVVARVLLEDFGLGHVQVFGVAAANRVLLEDFGLGHVQVFGVAAANCEVWVQRGGVHVDDAVHFCGILLLDLPCDGVKPVERLIVLLASRDGVKLLEHLVVLLAAFGCFWRLHFWKRGHKRFRLMTWWVYKRSLLRR